MSKQQDHSSKTAHWVHYSLLSGLVVSGLLLGLGLVLVFVEHLPRPIQVPQAGFELLRHAMHGEGIAILNLGLLILILTPGLRVAVLVVRWSLDGDWRFAAVALFVLVLLCFSMGLGMT